jgi:2-methylcitrate dehydratase PrpD
MNQKPTTKNLAQFVHRLKYEELPQSVIEKAKETVLDQLSGEIACATLPWNKIVYDYVKESGCSGQSTVVNYGLKTSTEFAALANATFGHGFEIDDWHLEALAHPGCIAVPSALSIGEQLGSTGKEVLCAVTAGSEIVLRIGLSMGKSMLSERGIHETCMEGTFGAAATVGKLFRLDEGKLLNALGIAGSHSSGTVEYTQTGGDVKRLHAGLGAMGGIRSALLARLGYTGPPTILEGKKGVLQAFSNKYDTSRIDDGLGEDYQLLTLSVKPYCCCGLIHSQIDAITQIMKENQLKPQDVDEIIMGADALSVAHCGSIGPEPTGITAAQFSTHFSLGLTVAKGANDFKAYADAMESNFRDPDVLEISRRVKVELDEECERNFPQKNLCKATIKTKDGRSFSTQVEHAKGTPGNPLTRDELKEKSMGLLTAALPEKKATTITDMILNLESLNNVSKLTELVVA